MTGLLVTGMHNSGTSMTAGVLAAAGWHPGEKLVPDNPALRKKYLEDASILALHRRWFAAALPPGDGHADWGMSTGGHLDFTAIPAAPAEAAAFVARRHSERERWLAKDPRACMVLPIWAQVPGLRFVLVYRSPWDTVESLLRPGFEPFVANPEAIRDAWAAHTKAQLDLLSSARERCLLVAAEGVSEAPVEFAGLVAEWTGEPLLGDPASGVDPALLVVTPDDGDLARRYCHQRPGDVALLAELDRQADLPRPPRSSRSYTGHSSPQ